MPHSLTASLNFLLDASPVNLAPAELPKGGGRYDLAIALGILAASSQIPADQLDNYELLGELALSGALRPVPGVLPSAICTRNAGRTLVVPDKCTDEATLVSNITVLGADSLLRLCAHLTGQALITPATPRTTPPRLQAYPDLADVRGQAMPNVR